MNSWRYGKELLFGNRINSLTIIAIIVFIAVIISVKMRG